MGYDASKPPGKRFTPDIERVNAEHVPRLVLELGLNEVSFTDDINLGVDGDRRVWLYKYGTLRSLDQVEDLNFALRIARTSVGIIVDRAHSHAYRHDYEGYGDVLDRVEAWFGGASPRGSVESVSLHINHPNELQFFGPLIAEQFSIQLDFIDEAMRPD
jgi:hypothetical protein